MKYRSRVDQIDVGHSLFSAVFRGTTTLSDHLFDTPALPRAMRAVNWIPETSVHHAIKVTDKLRDYDQFVGTQTMVVRDELRQKTHLVAIQTDGLFLYTVDNQSDISIRKVSNSHTRRAHICLRKYDGVPIISYAVTEVNGSRLFVNDTEISINFSDVDFPYLVIEQPTIGLPAVNAPSVGILSHCYRSRTQAAGGVIPLRE
jgi:hypothetical protein